MKEITKEEYYNIFKKYHDLGTPLKPVSSFTDIDGVLSFGYGVPAYDTDWGLEDEIICRCEGRKEHRLDNNWKYTFYENIKTDKK